MDTPFYEEWWFLIILILSALILLMMIVFGLVLHGQNKKYKSCGTGVTKTVIHPLNTYSILNSHTMSC